MNKIYNNIINKPASTCNALPCGQLAFWRTQWIWCFCL